MEVNNLAELKIRDLKPNGPPSSNNDLRRLVDEAHPPRASDINELHGLQKTKKEREGKPPCDFSSLTMIKPL